jgi:hypothetical protein
MEEFLNVFSDLLTGFIDKTNELDPDNIPRFQCKVVNDIYATIYESDSEYADELLKDKTIYGVCYVNLNNKFELLIKKVDFMNMSNTLFHEFVHIMDYYQLGFQEDNPDYRVLQEDCYFNLWSEFHACYLSHMYLLELGKNHINPQKTSLEFKKKITDYIKGNDYLDLQTTVDFVVRLYGEYIALEEKFIDIEKHPKGFFLNQKFLDIYDYLYEHRTFQSIVNCRDELEAQFVFLEQER